ncbi:MAG: hypothetical protein ACOYMN_02990 [Roseimicrobium sp.]
MNKLESGVRYEVKPALAANAVFTPRQVPTYYFTLDAPAPLHIAVSEPTEEPAPKSREVRTTAYCHAENDHVPYGRLTAAGGSLQFGKVCSAAADWSRFPVGTRFRIASQPGVLYEVDDYGSALVGSSTIDLYRPTIGSMNAWGVRRVEIEIVEWGSYEKSLRLMRDRIHYPHVRQMVAAIIRRKGTTSHRSSTAMAAPQVPVSVPFSM